MTNHITQFAEKISHSLLLNKEAKELIKERMHAGKMTKEEMKQLVDLLASEETVKKKVDIMIQKHFNC